MEKINEDFIKDTATMFADIQSDDIKLNYKDGVYYGYIEGFKKALELVKNNSVLDYVIKCDCKLEKHERAKMELDYNKCMDCKKPIE